ncbi:MAG: hypothetical protein ICV70_01295 [Jiangellaceae bacterium]|nr:hypothetical protein [Jiangellaceae bacterium]
MEPSEAHRRRQESMAWLPGQVIVNSTGAKVPRHPLTRLIPILARILWDRDGGERMDTVVLGWTRREVYLRMSDRRYNFAACWLDAADVQRR